MDCAIDGETPGNRKRAHCRQGPAARQKNDSSAASQPIMTYVEWLGVKDLHSEC
jgi:hypothetical protein